MLLYLWHLLTGLWRVFIGKAAEERKSLADSRRSELAERKQDRLDFRAITDSLRADLADVRKHWEEAERKIEDVKRELSDCRQDREHQQHEMAILRQRLRRLEDNDQNSLQRPPADNARSDTLDDGAGS